MARWVIKHEMLSIYIRPLSLNDLKVIRNALEWMELAMANQWSLLRRGVTWQSSLNYHIAVVRLFFYSRIVILAEMELQVEHSAVTQYVREAWSFARIPHLWLNIHLLVKLTFRSPVRAVNFESTTRIDTVESKLSIYGVLEIMNAVLLSFSLRNFLCTHPGNSSTNFSSLPSTSTCSGWNRNVIRCYADDT